MTTTINNSPIVNDVSSLKAGLTSTATSSAPPPELPKPFKPSARTLDKFVKPLANDPDELLKHRFLCRGGGLLLVGQTGSGKSSLAMQFMIKLGNDGSIHLSYGGKRLGEKQNRHCLWETLA